MKSFAFDPIKLFAEPKEKVEYTVYFKWGLITPKAGKAVFTVDPIVYNGADAFRYKIVLQSSRFFRSIYNLKDTMSSVMTSDIKVYEFRQNQEEQSKYKTTVSKILYNKENIPVNYRMIRHREGHLVEDTTVLLPNRRILDFVSAVAFLRSLDYANLHLGQEIPVAIIDGRDVIDAAFRYKGQSLLDEGNIRYATHFFTLDVFDDVFSRSRDAMEVWIGDDKNHLPIKIRSELKIGAGEVIFRKASGLKYPFTCKSYIR